MGLSTTPALTLAFYIIIACANFTCVITILRFRRIFCVSSFATIITSIHIYDFANALFQLIGFNAHTGKFNCGLSSIVTKTVELCTFFWVAFLAIKLPLTVRPMRISSARKTRLWDYIETSWVPHVFVFIFSAILTVIPLSELQIIRYPYSSYCYLTGFPSAKYWYWTFVSWYFWALVAFLVAATHTTIAIFDLNSYWDIPESVKSRFYFFFLYPISLCTYVTSIFLQDLIPTITGHDNDSTLYVLLVIESLANVGYTVGFWLLFRTAGTAWWLLWLDSYHGGKRLDAFIDTKFGKMEDIQVGDPNYTREEEMSNLVAMFGEDRSTLIGRATFEQAHNRLKDEIERGATQGSTTTSTTPTSTSTSTANPLQYTERTQGAPGMAAHMTPKPPSPDEHANHQSNPGSSLVQVELTSFTADEEREDDGV